MSDRGSIWCRVRGAASVGVLAAVAMAILFIGAAQANPPRGATLAHTGSLFPSDAPIPIRGAAISGSTMVVSGSEFIDGRSQEVIYVYTEPPGGWSGPPKPVATLTDSTGASVGGAAISGRTVAATSNYGVDVFTEPASGWSGVVHESARLTASDSAKAGGIASVSIDGPTIVAGGYGGTTLIPGEAYVFAEPAGGWAGSRHESAKLVAANGQGGDEFGSSVAISGETIAVSAPGVATSPTTSGGGRVYVFTRPARGWSGTLRQSATLSASNSAVYLAGDGQALGAEGVAVAGDTVFATASVPGNPGLGQAYVFTEPAGGWSGSVHEADALTVPRRAETLAASGRTLVVGAGSAYAFTEPAGGWGDPFQRAAIDFGPDASAVSVSGSTLLIGAPSSGTSQLGVFVEPPGGWAPTDTPAATVALSGPGGQFYFGSVAMSGGVAVAGAPLDTVGSNQNQGDAYVFTEPARGWSNQTETARLVASDGRAGDGFGNLLAASGTTIVVSRGGSRGTGLYVFSKPPTGWSGTVRDVAQLTVADPGAGAATSVAVSGRTIVAGFSGDCGGCTAGARAYVFTEPAGGWSGDIHESAKLTPSDQSSSCPHGLGAVAIDGPTVVAPGPYSSPGCGPGPAFVFTEPASGWSGTLQESARLTAPSLQSLSSVAISRSSVVAAGSSGNTPADPVVFNQPAGGWSGTIRPAASLRVGSGNSDGFDERVAASGDEIAALAIPENDQSCGPLPTCGAALHAFSQPAGGWKGTVAGSSTGIDLTEGLPLAVDGATIATGGDGAIDLFTPQPGQPSAGNASLSGLASDRPTLRLTFEAGQDAPLVRSLRLSLPNGLRFRPGRARGVSISAARRTIAVRPQSIAVTLKRPVQSLSVAIGPATLTARGNLVTQLRRVRRYNRAHRKQRVLTVPIGCLVTDAAGHDTPIKLKITIR